LSADPPDLRPHGRALVALINFVRADERARNVTGVTEVNNFSRAGEVDRRDYATPT